VRGIGDMKKLEYSIRGLMYFISLVIYTLLAAWVIAKALIEE
jgi:hypothetical protein